MEKKTSGGFLIFVNSTNNFLEGTKIGAQETLCFKWNKPRETFHFNTASELQDGRCMTELINSEVFSLIWDKQTQTISFKTVSWFLGWYDFKRQNRIPNKNKNWKRDQISKKFVKRVDITWHLSHLEYDLPRKRNQRN